MFTALLVIAILILLIVAHEFGHYVAAKIFKVRVEEFGIGYPPRAFLLWTRKGTEYSLNWLPFGGFVKLYGDVGSGVRGRGTLVDAPKWKQAVILVAGVAMNALMAWVLFAFALHAGVPRVVDAALPGENAHLIVASVVDGSPAQAAGLVAGDEMLGITDARGRKPKSLTPEETISFVRLRGGEPLTITFIHNGTTTVASLIPANAVVPDAAGRAALGLGLALVSTQPAAWDEAISLSFRRTGQAFISVAGDLGAIASSFIKARPDLGGVVGPVGIVNYVGQASQTGAGAVLLLAGLISVNLAIINLIPIPALDGGRLFILLIESIMRRDVSRLAVQLLNAAGIALIVILMLVVTYHDIARIFS